MWSHDPIQRHLLHVVKVTIFHAEQHTLLIQSLQQGIFCVFTSLAAVVLVLRGQNLVSCSQPLFPVDCRKGACYMRLARPLFRTGLYCFQYKLNAIIPCVKSGLATLGYNSSWFPPFLNPLLSLVISPLAATMADDDNHKDNGPVGRRSLYFTAKYLYNISSYHMCETVNMTA